MNVNSNTSETELYEIKRLNLFVAKIYNMQEYSRETFKARWVHSDAAISRRIVQLYYNFRRGSTQRKYPASLSLTVHNFQLLESNKHFHAPNTICLQPSKNRTSGTFKGEKNVEIFMGIFHEMPLSKEAKHFWSSRQIFQNIVERFYWINSNEVKKYQQRRIERCERSIHEGEVLKRAARC